MIFIFLGCVAIVLKDWFILQDNKFIKTVTAWSDFEWWTPVLFKSVTAYSDSVGFVEPLWAQCNSMLRFSKEISLIAICNFLIINPCKIWNCHDIRRFFQLDHCDSILRFFQVPDLNTLKKTPNQSQGYVKGKIFFCRESILIPGFFMSIFLYPF